LGLTTLQRWQLLRGGSGNCSITPTSANNSINSPSRPKRR
jgi:hypothetical protein